jgi:hypothetical protein
MDSRIGLVRAPTLLVGASADPFALPHLPTVRAALVNAATLRIEIIEGGTIPLMEQSAEEVAAHIEAFLTKL